MFGRSLVSYNKLLVVLIKVWKLPKIFVKFQSCSEIEINSLTCFFNDFTWLISCSLLIILWNMKQIKPQHFDYDSF